jgi:hypothetical protein
MLKGIKGIVAIAAAGLLVVAIAYAGYMSSQPPAAGGDPGEQLRVTLDPQQFPGNIREAYEIAGRDPALLSQLHCYCGCDKALGHRNLLDCYRDTHASRCEICLGEALDAEPMARRGMAVEQIRDALRARYAHGS